LREQRPIRQLFLFSLVLVHMGGTRGSECLSIC